MVSLIVLLQMPINRYFLYVRRERYSRTLIGSAPLALGNACLVTVLYFGVADYGLVAAPAGADGNGVQLGAVGTAFLFLFCGSTGAALLAALGVFTHIRGYPE